jgi:hypothetical protein
MYAHMARLFKQMANLNAFQLRWKMEENLKDKQRRMADTENATVFMDSRRL